MLSGSRACARTAQQVVGNCDYIKGIYMIRTLTIWTFVLAIILPAISKATDTAPSVLVSFGAISSNTIVCAPSTSPKIKVRKKIARSLITDKTQNISFYCSPNIVATTVPNPTKEKDNSAKWLDFFRHLVEALAWPIVAILVVWRVGPEIKKKIPLLKKLKAGPVEAEFNEEVAALRQEAEAQFPKSEQDKAVSTEEARLLELAKVSPRSAIIEAWRTVEVVANQAVLARTTTSRISDLKESRVRSPVALARELGTRQILNSQQLSVFHELRYLRNQAAHAEDFETNFESVNNYIQLTEALRFTIQQSMEYRNNANNFSEENL
jgi:hypothetical protein